ncbi:MAG: sigma-70 family RNA polymerase sigma factor [Planctomycetaceae bacterium]|nr:sigma-70 family RNA polymerase sigma factor [Planctomycetota bacterium]NUN52738.1 sigma-70 family RNA polymerase sigma factor [Planctomycetaceae bacterium]
MDPSTDEDLVLRTAGGDSEAFEVLLDRWEGPAKRYAWRLLGDWQAAEDAAQEAFLRVHRASAEYRPTARFSTWFYTVLGNVCRDHLRRLRRRPQEGAARPLGEGEDEPVAPGDRMPGPEEEVLAAERRALVAEAVRSLPLHLQQAVALREFEGLKYREIAETLGCDLNEVKVLIHRGRKALAEKLRRVMRG